MPKTIYIPLHTPGQVANKFFKYVLEKDIGSKIRKKLDKKTFFTPEERDAKFNKFLYLEYIEFVKMNNISKYIREDGWNKFIND